MATNSIVIQSDKGGARTNTSAFKTTRNVSKKTSLTNGGNDTGSSLKNISKGIRMLRTLDTGSLGLFGGTSGGAVMMTVQELGKSVSKGVEITLDINVAKTGERVRAGNTKRSIGYAINPSSYVMDATYGEYLRDLRISRENIVNSYYRDLTGNLTYGKQYGIKK